MAGQGNKGNMGFNWLSLIGPLLIGGAEVLIDKITYKKERNNDNRNNNFPAKEETNDS